MSANPAPTDGPGYHLDWFLFHERGMLLRDLCADLLRCYGLDVRIHDHTGEGRYDLEVHRGAMTLFPSSSNDACWAECKQRSGSEQPIDQPEIEETIKSALDREICHLMVLTNGDISRPARDIISTCNRTMAARLEMRCVERGPLEHLVRSLPEIYVKYFEPDADPTEYESEGTMVPEVTCNLSVDSKYADEARSMRLALSNTGIRAETLSIIVDGKKQRDVEVLGFQHKDIAIPLNLEGTSRWPALEIVSASSLTSSNIKIIRELPDRPAIHIDHIFADPLKNVQRILEQYATSRCIYLEGSPGTGKSRLLREVARKVKGEVIWFDLSLSNYSVSLLDCLITAILGVDISMARTISKPVLRAILRQQGLAREEFDLIVGYVVEEEDTVDLYLLMRLVARRFCTMSTAATVVLDNIHRFGPVDAFLARELMTAMEAPKIMFSARINEVSEHAGLVFVEELRASDQVATVTITSGTVEAVLSTFIEQAAVDERTRAYLRKYRLFPSLQEFFFALKTIKEMRALDQQPDGRLALCSGSTPDLSTHRFAEIHEHLMKGLSLRDTARVPIVLQAASCYGFTFPVEFIRRQYGDGGIEALEILLRAEVLSEVRAFAPGGQRLRFDHELTQEVVFQSMTSLRRRPYHEYAVDFLKKLDKRDPEFSYADLSHHCERIGDIYTAISAANEEGEKLSRSARSEAARRYYERAKKLCDELNVDLAINPTTVEVDCYGLEAVALRGLARTTIDLHGDAQAEREIGALLACLRLHHDPQMLAEAHLLYGGVLLGRNEFEAARSYLEEAIREFDALGEPTWRARAINTLGILEKVTGRNGVFSARLHREAIHVFRHQGDLGWLSTAYASFGAVLLEFGRGDKTARWWKKSLDAIERTTAHLDICRRLIDYSYVIALYANAPGENVLGRLQEAVMLAERLGIRPDLVRALLNEANYRMFELNDLGTARDLLMTALEIARRDGLDYQLLLTSFSLAMISRLEGNDPAEHDEAVLAVLAARYSVVDGTHRLNDNRVNNMIEFYQSTCQIAHSSRAQLEGPRAINPYACKGLFKTYF